jgi:DNA-binding MarR family transcriptional regulator
MVDEAPRVGLAFLVSQVGAHAAGAFAEALAALDLRPAHAGILRLVATGEPFTQRSLSARLGVQPSQTVGLIDTLERRKLLERRRDVVDRRNNQLTLTPEGHVVHREIERVTASLEQELFAPLSAAERRTLLDLLGRVAAHRGLVPGVHPAWRSLIPPSPEQPLSQTFRARVVRGDGKNTAGLLVPPPVIEALGRGRRPPVVVTLLGYTFRTTIGSMGGDLLVPLSAEHRAACGLGDLAEVDVTLAADDAERTTPVPDDLAAALDAAGARAAFDRLAPSRRKEHVRQVEEAKAAATRERRIAKVVAEVTGAA